MNTLWQHLRCRWNSTEHVLDTFSRRWHRHDFDTQSIQRGRLVIDVLWLHSWQWPDPKLPTREHLPVYLIRVHVLYCHFSQNPTHSQVMNTYWYFQWCVYINTLWPSGVIRRHRSGPTIGSTNGLLSDDTKPLAEQMLTYHDKCPVAFTWEQVSPMNLIRNMCSELTLVKLLPRLPWANESY